MVDSVWMLSRFVEQAKPLVEGTLAKAPEACSLEKRGVSMHIIVPIRSSMLERRGPCQSNRHLSSTGFRVLLQPIVRVVGEEWKA